MQLHMSAVLDAYIEPFKFDVGAASRPLEQFPIELCGPNMTFESFVSANLPALVQRLVLAKSGDQLQSVADAAHMTLKIMLARHYGVIFGAFVPFYFGRDSAFSLLADCLLTFLVIELPQDDGHALAAQRAISTHVSELIEEYLPGKRLTMRCSL